MKEHFLVISKKIEKKARELFSDDIVDVASALFKSVSLESIESLKLMNKELEKCIRFMMNK